MVSSDGFLVDFEQTFSRRELLRKSFLGGISFLALSLVPTGCARYPEVSRKLQFLSAKDVHILSKIADVFFPKDGEIPYSASDADVVGWTDAHFSRTSHETQKIFKIALHVLEISPRLFFFSFHRFSALSETNREKFFESLYHSRSFIKTVLYQFIKVPCSLAYYSNEKVKQSIGYELLCG